MLVNPLFGSDYPLLKRRGWPNAGLAFLCGGGWFVRHRRNQYGLLRRLKQ